MAKRLTPQQASAAIKRFGKLVPNVIADGFNEGLKFALRLSITKFMVGGGKSAPTLPTKLRIRGGGLRRSVGILPARRDGNNFTGGLKATAPYARIHEKGGITHPRVTDRMRAFAWAMFKKTGEPMWRGLALTKKRVLTIKIRKRPYLEPALKAARKDIERQIDKSISRLVDIAIG